MAPKIPDRWIPYKACGDVIEGTRIICFKVPLHKNVQTDPDITKIWDIPAVLAEIPQLGAVIDLTNTARYYNPRDFEAAGVRHLKILMPGREIPPENKVLEFMDAVDEFLRRDCDSLVGVHCTHGLNRTGYMVCRYMRDRLNIPAEEAIKRFEKARGYEIEREIYLASLLDKNLPRPDFEADDRQRRDVGETQEGNNYESNSRKRTHSQSRNSNEGLSTSFNCNQTNNENVILTKDQRKKLRKKLKNKLRRQKKAKLQKYPENLTNPHGNQTKPQGSQTNTGESQTISQESHIKSQGSQTNTRGSQIKSQESHIKSQGSQFKSKNHKGKPKKRKIYNYQ